MQSKAKTVAEYLAEVPMERRPVLTRFRKIIKKAAPSAIESMQYGMACYEIGEIIFSFASQKHFIALYVGDADLVKANRDELGATSVGKACIRYSPQGEIPWDAVTNLIETTIARRIAALKQSQRDGAQP